MTDDALDAVRMVENALAAAVRAEAVADERQRLAAIGWEAVISRAVQGRRPSDTVAIAAAVRSTLLAAGSVPVATPELCGWWDGPEDHVYGICNQPKGHHGRHAETLADGTHWAGWGGGSRPPAPATRGTATDPWVANPTEPAGPNAT